MPTVEDSMFNPLILAEGISAIGKQLMPEQQESLLIQGSFDESGKLNDSEIVAFGGCVGSANQMSGFTPIWFNVLEQSGLRHTSMKEAMHLRGAYETWKDRQSERDDVLRKMAQLVMSAGFMIIGVPMTSSEFKTLPEHQRKKFNGDLQYCGFEACVSVMLHSIPGASLHILCDLSEEYAAKCIRLFNKLRSKDPLVKRSCYALTFGDDTRIPGLQIADMISYCTRAHHLRNVKAPEPIVSELISILKLDSEEDTTAHFAYRSDGEGLGEGFIQGDIPRWER